ncbi:MAG TPA: SDR family NAD(P)-dependent oxidoreductase, partial [Propionibacteriaceae bacterium]|nr:SDR family NAD(P)-dependent oxidoreductase [Propionibacteriaceae bacterium]
MTDEFKDTVIVVTGAAGGVGQAVSGWLAVRGARVFDLDRRQPAPAVGEFVPADVLDPDSIDDAVATVVAKAGRIDG